MAFAPGLKLADGPARPSLQTNMYKSVEVREFFFFSEDDPYGLVVVGAKVCEVLPMSLASDAGVVPGWYIASIDGHDLPGAMQKLVRRVPVVTTDEVHDLLAAKRCEAVDLRRHVKITFWTSPAPFREDREEDEKLEADSVDALKNILVSKYGSVVAAWDEALDMDHSGQLNYIEFVAACRACGFEGSLKAVFRQLDKDGSGVISLHELDPTCAMDFTRGRCIVCTLLNPCETHGEDVQKRHALAERMRIARKTSVAHQSHSKVAVFGEAHKDASERPR